jgi:hypothetical protein
LLGNGAALNVCFKFGINLFYFNHVSQKVTRNVTAYERNCTVNLSRLREVKEPAVGRAGFV